MRNLFPDFKPPKLLSFCREALSESIIAYNGIKDNYSRIAPQPEAVNSLQPGGGYRKVLKVLDYEANIIYWPIDSAQQIT